MVEDQALTVDNAPAILAASDLLATNDNSLLRANNGKGNDVLDLGIEGNFLLVVLFVVVWVHAQVVEGKLLPYPFLELGSFLQGQTIALGNDGHNIDKFRQLLEDDNVDGLQTVTRGLDEKQTAVDAGILKIALALGRQLLAQVGAVLVLDVFDNGVPAAFIVDKVAVTGRVDNVEAQAHAVFLDQVRHGLNFRRGADWLGWRQTAF